MAGVQDAMSKNPAMAGMADQMGAMMENMGVPGGADALQRMMGQMTGQTAAMGGAAAAGLGGGPPVAPATDVERALVLRLATVPEIVLRAWDLRAPNHIAETAYEVAGAFNRFYEQCHVLGEEDPARQASWLTLVEATLATLTRLLDLLGIRVPERM